MYIVINTENDRICSEWNHMTETTRYICWKTPQEIKFANSYRNHDTHMKKFFTKREAEIFIKNQNNSDKLTVIATNFIQRVWNKIINHFRVKHNNNFIHQV